MNDNSSYAGLADALGKRIGIIADRDWYIRDAVTHLQALQAVSERIETLVAELPRPLPGELAHFLEKRSYEKALAWMRQAAADHTRKVASL